MFPSCEREGKGYFRTARRTVFITKVKVREIQNYQNELKQITAVLLRPEDQYDELTKAVHDLSRLFLAVSGLEIDDEHHREHLYLSQGKAIGPVWAAMCVREILRTKRFLRGFYLGIKAALARFSNRPLHILYAGTGPFATLAIPLTTVFTSEEVHFTFLEINPLSIQSLEKVITAFQVERYLYEVVKCDATKYQADPSNPIQMIVTETMQNALQKEPQVAITMNLAPQMQSGGILIPQNITIDAVLLSPRKNLERMTDLNGFEQDYFHKIGKVFELNKDTPRLSSKASLFPSGTFSFPKVELEIPRGLAPDYKQLCLFTTIRVFEEERLTNGQCSLTLPKQVMILEQEKRPVERVSFQYIPNENPGFEWEIS